nr:hypothetical protein [Kibdelosporangium sp. MJ126-NF4]CTQ98267.1 hypothetical protein [Kibdelosporangium sp. MJ126-NF4]
MQDLTALLAADVADLCLRVVVVLDWHDGPLEGIAELAEPVDYWYFRLLAARPSSADLDDRLYEFSPLPDDVRAELGHVAGKPLHWPFHNRPEETALANRLTTSAYRPELVVRSKDFHEVLGIWPIARHGK